MWAIGKMLDASSKKTDTYRRNDSEAKKIRPIAALVRIVTVLKECASKIKNDADTGGDK